MSPYPSLTAGSNVGSCPRKTPSENDDIVVKKLARFDECGVEEVWFLRISLGDILCYRRTEGTLRRVIDGRAARLPTPSSNCSLYSSTVRE